MAGGGRGPLQTYRSGSAEDFHRLYRATYPQVYRTLRAILRDPAEAEDCAQDAFVQAFQAWIRWKSDGPAEAWIHRIAVNRAISLRRRARLRSVPELLRRLRAPRAPEDPSDIAAQRDLLAALRAIPPRLAAAIVLRHYHGYTNREIAAALGVSERTVGTRLNQARTRLRKVLGDWDFSLEPLPALTNDNQESYARR